jgi:Spy/CpxP family protein refolding chaperone
MAALLFVLFMAGSLMAQAPGPPASAQGGSGALNLTEDQEKQIQELKTGLHKAVTPLRSRLHVMEAELQALSVAESPDEVAISRKIEEMGKLRIQIQKLEVLNRVKIRNLLTDEQKVRFDNMGQRMRKRRAGGRFSRIGGRMDSLRRMEKPGRHIRSLRLRPAEEIPEK